jgi:hypothetical protein
LSYLNKESDKNQQKTGINPRDQNKRETLFFQLFFCDIVVRVHFYTTDSSLIATLTLKFSALKNVNSLRKAEKCFIHLYSSETKN